MFEPLGIPQFELSPAERRRAATQDEEEPQKRSSVRFSGIPDKSTQSRHDEARRLSIMGARRVRLEAQKRGLILLTCGVYGNVIRFLAPLTIEEEVLAEGVDILEASIAAVKEKQA